MSAIEMWTGLVSTVGFPIAAFLMMWHLAHRTIKENTEALQDLKNELSSLKGEVE